ncbi:YwdI family protein [Geobacillus subterraneus]|uniref:YwdI family protein n=1 Tax=Geobacillus subterraneus TaxID=129338 RepID=UPI00161916AE
MSISFTAVVAKMEDELRKAKAANDPQRMREHIAAVRALCDLMLETTAQPQPAVPSLSTGPLVVGGPFPAAGGLSVGGMAAGGTSPDIDDDANGASLLDF